MKKKYLEMILDSIKPHPNPKSSLEQYTTEGKLASELLLYAQKDILNNVVFDLGCGTGRLSIGTKLLGAKKVFGFDIDSESILCGIKNLKILYNNPILDKLDINKDDLVNNIHFITKDIKDINFNYIESLMKEYNLENYKRVVIQNPPFGSQKRNADRIFLKKSLEIGDVIYTIHNSKTRDFVIKYIEDNGGQITHIFKGIFRIPMIYHFHKKKNKFIDIDIYRIVKVK